MRGEGGREEGWEVQGGRQRTCVFSVVSVIIVVVVVVGLGLGNVEPRSGGREGQREEEVGLRKKNRPCVVVYYL